MLWESFKRFWSKEMNKVPVQDLDIVPFVLPVYVILDNELALQSILVTLSSMQ